jgi:rhodanese-related sulfurtransferase
VEVNRRGPKGYAEALAEIKRLGDLTADAAKTLDRSLLIVDARPAHAFRKGHLKGAINIPLGKSFNTWLGTIVDPKERYYLVVSSPAALESALEQVLAIGYEENLVGVYLATDYAEETGPERFPDVEVLRNDGKAYTVVDVRDPDEVGANPGIPHSLKIRLADLREELDKIPADKPAVVHCAGGYRSAVGSSILLSAGRRPVYDVGEAIIQIL